MCFNQVHLLSPPFQRLLYPHHHYSLPILYVLKGSWLESRQPMQTSVGEAVEGKESRGRQITCGWKLCKQRASDQRFNKTGTMLQYFALIH